jgi:hypothetical protein
MRRIRATSSSRKTPTNGRTRIWVRSSMLKQRAGARLFSQRVAKISMNSLWD